MITKDAKKAVENHDTAAWSNIEKSDDKSKVSHPSLEQTNNAKDYVDENEK